MPAGLTRYYGSHDLHFITCSCDQRRPFLDTPTRRTLLLTILEETRLAYDFVVVGYVVMPEHMHLLITEPEKGSPSLVMQVVKQRFARQVLKQLRRECSLWEDTPRQIWQRRFYDFNVWSEGKRVDKLRYMHRNPVDRRLVLAPEQWMWSSFRSYAFGEPGMVLINAPGSARFKTRVPA